MKAVLLPLTAFVFLSFPAHAQQGDQTEIVQTPAITVDPSTVMRDDSLVFDLDDTTSAPLPAGTRDYETATPADVEMISDIEFDL